MDVSICGPLMQKHYITGQMGQVMVNSGLLYPFATNLARQIPVYKTILLINMLRLKQLLEVESISMISVAAIAGIVIVIHNNQITQETIHAYSPLPASNSAVMQP